MTPPSFADFAARHPNTVLGMRTAQYEYAVALQAHQAAQQQRLDEIAAYDRDHPVDSDWTCGISSSNE